MSTHLYVEIEELRKQVDHLKHVVDLCEDDRQALANERDQNRRDLERVSADLARALEVNASLQDQIQHNQHVNAELDAALAELARLRDSGSPR